MGMALSSSQREMLQRFSRATFANPFGDERWELDGAIAGKSPSTSNIVEHVVAKLESTLASLESRNLQDYEGEDVELVEHALLFEAFHRFAPPFDVFIRQQAKSDKPLAFPLGAEVGSFLVERGFPEARVGRALELFYQLRRSYFFIASGLVGRSPCMRALRETLWNQVFTRDVRRYERHLWNRMEDFSTLILGATGTGKGAAASAIGRSGFIAFKDDQFEASFMQTFLPVNLSEMPGTLLESALFGHEKGAFTGAIAKHDGVFARSLPHGSIFLDEIGEVSVPAQIKLLRVLQERAFTPLGSERTLRFDGRVIAATHRSLDTLRAEGRFRNDFYYRLCSDMVNVPSLRERLDEEPAELNDLLEVVVERIVGSADKELLALTQKSIARDIPSGYAWPGNVRELEQCVRRVLLTGRCGPDTSAPSKTGHADPFWLKADEGDLDAKQLLAGYCALLHQRHGTYEKVAQITGLDRRTVRKHVLAGAELIGK